MQNLVKKDLGMGSYRLRRLHFVSVFKGEETGEMLQVLERH